VNLALPRRRHQMQTGPGMSLWTSKKKKKTQPTAKNVAVDDKQGSSLEIVDVTRSPVCCNPHNLCVQISRVGKGAASECGTFVGHLTKSRTAHELFLENQDKYPEDSMSLTEQPLSALSPTLCFKIGLSRSFCRVCLG